MSAQDGRHGCEIRADYLGARMLSTLSTGLGALQKSLAELYFRFRQTNNHVNAVCQQRLLRVTSDGLHVTSQPTGEHDELHPTSCLLYWDAVQFVTVKSGSGVQCAFEPIDNDISRNTSNLYWALDKHYYFLQQLQHPPLYACVIRRSQGLKALDVHVYICNNDQDALNIVTSLRSVSMTQRSHEIKNSSVFSYNPFSKVCKEPEVEARDLSASPTRVTSPTEAPSPAAATPGRLRRHPAPNPVRRARSADTRVPRVITLTQNDFPPAAAPEDRTPMSAGERLPAVTQLSLSGQRCDSEPGYDEIGEPEDTSGYSSGLGTGNSRSSRSSATGLSPNLSAVTSSTPVRRSATPNILVSPTTEARRKLTPTIQSPSTPSPSKLGQLTSLASSTPVTTGYERRADGNGLVAKSHSQTRLLHGSDDDSDASDERPVSVKDRAKNFEHLAHQARSRNVVVPQKADRPSNRPIAKVSPQQAAPPQYVYKDLRQGVQLRKSKSHNQIKEVRLSANCDTQENWQLGLLTSPSASSSARDPHTYENQPSSATSERDSSPVGENLLLSQKKDAEIASVMQNLRSVSGKNTWDSVATETPSRNNFERSLGYFP